MNKRGVSPLIATILLLVFAIGLGLIVMNWGRAQVEAASRCAVSTGLSIVELNNIPEICYAGQGENGYIHFIIENGPNVDIESILLRIIGEKDVYNVEIKEKVPIGNSLLKDINYNFNRFGEIRQIKISPKIILYPEEEPILCPEQAIVIGEIRSC
jgi:flagellin-like protein